MNEVLRAENPEAYMDIAASMVPGIADPDALRLAELIALAKIDADDGLVTWALDEASNFPGQTSTFLCRVEGLLHGQVSEDERLQWRALRAAKRIYDTGLVRRITANPLLATPPAAHSLSPEVQAVVTNDPTFKQRRIECLNASDARAAFNSTQSALFACLAEYAATNF